MDIYSKQIEEYIEVINNTNHSEEEKKGLIDIYKNIEANQISKFPLLSVDLLSMQQALYLHCAHPIGTYRTSNTCITGSDIKTCEYSKIYKHINALEGEYAYLLKMSNNIEKELDLENYIKCCIVLMCKIIEIHPFNDGNGRVSRALFNYLLRQVEIPPVNIVVDKERYLKCQEAAIMNKDYTLINDYYLGKIKKGKEECKKTK